MTAIVILILALGILCDIVLLALIVAAWMAWNARHDPVDEPDYSGGM